MAYRLGLLALLLWTLPALASGALYEVHTGRLQASEPGFLIDIKYPLVRGLAPQAEQAFNRISRQRAHDMVAEFEKESRENQQAGSEAPGMLEQSLKLGFETKHLSSKMLAVLFQGSEYTGGAHPNPVLYSLLVDPSNGRKLAVTDLFSSDQGLKRLSELAAQQLEPRVEELNTQRTWLLEGLEPNPENYAVVWPGNEGLHIVFPPYQIAPYSSGAPEVVIPYDQLQSVLNPRFFDL